MSVFANDSTTLMLCIGLVLFGLVAAFLFWTRPRPEENLSRETDTSALVTTRCAIGQGRGLITVRYGDHEHLLLIGPQSDVLIDSRKIVEKTNAAASKASVPMPFPPASDYRVMTPRVMPVPQPVFEQPPEPVMPQVPVPQAQFVPEPVAPTAPPAPREPMREPVIVQEDIPPYQAPAYQTPIQTPSYVPPPSPVAPAPSPQAYDNVFQASIQTVQTPVFTNFEPSAQPPAPPPATPSAPEPAISVPAFLQSKINPVMMEQALPPAEALPPAHWPEHHDHDAPISNWEASLPPLRASLDTSPPQAPMADHTLDLAARQLEDALRQKLAETHQKSPDSGHQTGFQPHPADEAQRGAQAEAAPQTSPDAAADRFEQEIRKLLGRDLKKL